MKYDNQLRYAVKIINDYDGRSPLSSWLKGFFRENKQMGSRDRKTVSEMVYGFYRLGHTRFESVEERILAGAFLGNNLPEVVKYFKEKKITDLPATDDGQQAVPAAVNYPGLFPYESLLSQGVDPVSFNDSFLTQPDLFLRIRPGNEEQVIQKLNGSGIRYERMNNNCISLPNTTKVNDILQINKEVVIQDRSSQITGQLLEGLDIDKPSVWDCCAASGGKSIMVADLHKEIDLTVSDMRVSIINNLKQRFEEAGIKNYRSFAADLTDKNSQLPSDKYDLIIADVPCTGSGTWGRTPEQLYFFKEGKIDYYTNIQQRIVSSVIPSLKEGGALLYITCSVFAKENEEMATLIMERHHLKLKKQELIKGYENKADTMFAALFTN